MLWLGSCAHELHEKYCAKVVGATSSKGFLVRTVRSWVLPTTGIFWDTLLSEGDVPSVLWRCWLGGMKGIQPVKTEWWGSGVVTCLERSANDLHMVQLIPLPPIISCSGKIQNGVPFCRLTQVVLEKGRLTGVVVVVVTVRRARVLLQLHHCVMLYICTFNMTIWNMWLWWKWYDDDDENDHVMTYISKAVHTEFRAERCGHAMICA